MLDNYAPSRQPLELEYRLTTSGRPVVAVFFSYWCEDTQAVAPALEDLARTYGEQMELVRVDVDEAEDLAKAYRVAKTPTVIAFHSGKEIGRVEGETDVAKYQKLYEQSLPAGTVH